MQRVGAKIVAKEVCNSFEWAKEEPFRTQFSLGFQQCLVIGVNVCSCQEGMYLAITMAPMYLAALPVGIISGLNWFRRLRHNVYCSLSKVFQPISAMASDHVRPTSDGRQHNSDGLQLHLLQVFLCLFTAQAGASQPFAHRMCRPRSQREHC